PTTTREDMTATGSIINSPRTAGPQPRDVLRLGSSPSARLERRRPSPATFSGSDHLLRLASNGGAPAPRRSPARIISFGSPRTAGPQPRDVLRLGSSPSARLERRGPSPATFSGSYYGHAPSNSARRSSSSALAYAISIVPSRSLPRMRTRVMSARWSDASTAASSAE